MYQLVMKKALTDENRSKINDVISQFFEEFNPKSSIDLKNGECHILVVFEQPPKELIKKMMECNPDEFSYGISNATDNDGKNQSDSDNTDESKEETETDSEDSDESEEETETDSEDSDESEEETETDSKDSDESEEETETDLNDSDELEEETETDSKDSDESEEETETDSEGSDESEEETETDSEDSDESEEETETDLNDSDESEEETDQKAENDEAPIATMPKTKKVGGQIKECGEIKLLLDLAAESSSYEEFVKLIVKTINFGKREEFFVKLVDSFTANKEAGLAKISKDLEISKNDYNSMGMQVSNYFKRNGEKISFGGFINEVVKYKDYSFKTGNEDSKIETSDSAEQTEVKNVVPVIPEFEEFLGNIDKTISIEKRVEAVLSYIDPKIEKRIWDQRAIRNYMIAGISLKVITNEAIMKKDRWLPPDARMKTSMLVTDFIKAKSNGSELVKVVDFLEYLKKFILTEEELRKL